MKDDIFALLSSKTDIIPTDTALTIISLWRLATYYVSFFTLHPERFASHRDDEKKVVYLCPGGDCPALAAGVRATEHIYLPVWDVENRRVTVLRFDTRPDGPSRQILDFLKLYKGQLADLVAVLDCKGDGKGTFAITAHRPLPETDRGALACRAFCDGLDAGIIDLRSCVKRLSTEEIAELPSIKRKATRLVGDPIAPAISTSTPFQAPIGEPMTPLSKPVDSPGTLPPASGGRPVGAGAEPSEATGSVPAGEEP